LLDKLKGGGTNKQAVSSGGPVGPFLLFFVPDETRPRALFFIPLEKKKSKIKGLNEECEKERGMCEMTMQ
jgi:hypothetical protein